MADPLYAYWHGATFSNDGKTVVFTDEWGGGTAARCRATDQLSWGGDAIYDIVDGKLAFRSYYKLPVAQTNQENCVSHIPSLVPVPGRDMFVQAWYQGGVSLVDLTTRRNPWRSATSTAARSARRRSSRRLLVDLLVQRRTYGTEIARGFDVVRAHADGQLTANEIASAERLPKRTRINGQSQDQVTTWTSAPGKRAASPAPCPRRSH